ncbi:MAG: LamG-like jellyroll fold domain-containing protein [Brevinematia bacterium]
MNKTLRLTFLFFIIFLFYSFNKFENISTFELKGREWKIYRIEGLSLKKDRNGRYFIGLSENLDDKNADLIIDFENLHFSSERYRNLYASFIINKNEKFAGNSSGKFSSGESSIKLLPLETSIFYPGKEIGSFSIDFWLYPYKNYDKQYIVYYLGEDVIDPEQRRYGFSIYIEDGKLKYRFENFFYNSDKKKIIENLEISEDEPIALYKWEHHAISFNARNGKLVIYRNGIEERTIRVTEGFSVNGAIYYPYINKNINSPLIIGKNSFFSLDNLRFMEEFITNFDLFPLNRKEAFLITEVMKISENLFFLKDIKLNFKADDNSFLKLAYRISDEIFSPDNTKIPWVYVNLENFNPPAYLNRGKYIQFKIIVYPELAVDDIKLYSATLKYSIDEAPYRPRILKVMPGDGEVEIQWLPSPEDDVAGYEIYYGNESKNYICNDAKEGSSPVFVKRQGVGLEAHRAKLSLINEKPYFISIRTVDVNGHKSDYSEEIYVRPSSIYNSNGYSIDR